ncbi:MAG: hypothetical protein KDC53_13355 [Saprospiraceae bacterium]|nr:hypothetical protein [Saprospiraceae bacterium]
MSVATLTYDDSKGVYSIDLRMFLDDYLVISGDLKEENNPFGQILSTPAKGEIRDYLEQHFKIYFNGQQMELKVNKVKTEEVTIHVVIEIKSTMVPAEIKEVKVEDTIYVDQFINQRNVIHITLPEKSKKSLLFNKYQRVLNAQWDD